uniref:Uncharacterized protein n=1 Tax=Melopsittacus undulatus TaxID=13146 RepID=A0A8V5G9P5_MELUD
PLGLDPRRMGVDLGTSALLNLDSYFLFLTYIMLVFDSVLYMLLAMYFDKVLPGRCSLYLHSSRRCSTRKMPQTPVNPKEEELLFMLFQSRSLCLMLPPLPPSVLFGFIRTAFVFMRLLQNTLFHREILAMECR